MPLLYTKNELNVTVKSRTLKSGHLKLSCFETSWNVRLRVHLGIELLKSVRIFETLRKEFEFSDKVPFKDLMKTGPHNTLIFEIVSRWHAPNIPLTEKGTNLSAKY